MSLHPVKSAERTIRVLELFQKQQQPQTLHEVATQLRMPVPSTLAILRTLVGMGYLILDVRRKTYFPHYALCEPRRLGQRTVLREQPVLKVAERLREETSEQVLVTMQNDLHVHYVRVLQGSGAKDCGTQLVVNSASGLALLGTMADNSIDRICRRINMTHRPAERSVEPDKIIGLVRKFDRQGYGVLTGVPHPNRMYLSMLMPPTPSGKRFAISVGGSRARLTLHSERLLSRMYETIAAA